MLWHLIKHALLYGFFDLRTSKKAPLLEKSPNGAEKTFFFLNFCLVLYQNAYNFVQNCQILCFKSI